MEFCSLRSLVEEITGIDEENEKFFEATYKEVQRIEKEIRKISSYNDTNGIPKDNKDKLVCLIRGFYNDKEKFNVLKKYTKGKLLTDEESLILFDIFISNADKEIQDAYIHRREEIRIDPIMEDKDEMNQCILDVIKLANEFDYTIQSLIIAELKREVKKLANNMIAQIEPLKRKNESMMLLETQNRIVDRDAELHKMVNNYPKKKKKIQCKKAKK